ncbi:MAG: hypothetical protein HY319_12485 [Armatimonadetes bacterium]|nr:hypothetical protein [Armatimonadota bacterium]
MSTIRATLQFPWSGTTGPRRLSAEAPASPAGDGAVDALMNGQPHSLGFWEGRRCRGLLRKMARLIGDSSVAAAEMKLLWKEAPAETPPSEFLQPYVELLEASEGLDPAAVRDSFFRLQHPADPQLPAVYRSLLQASRGRAVQALQHLDWLERNTAPGAGRIETAALCSGILAIYPESSPQQVQATLPRLQKLAAPGVLKLLESQLQRDVPLEEGVARLEELQARLGPGEDLAAALDRSLRMRPAEAVAQQPAPLPAPDPQLVRVEELCGNARAAAEEMNLLRAAVPEGQDPKGFLDRYLALLQAADGVNLEAVRTAFLFLEQKTEYRSTYLELLAATGRNAASALFHLEWLLAEGRDPRQVIELVERLQRALPELDGSEVVPALAGLRDPATAVDRFQNLVRIDVPAPEAVADLQFLETCRLDIQAEAFGYLRSLRSLLPGDRSIREGLELVLGPGEAGSRRKLSSCYRALLALRPQPALALEDLRWLTREGVDTDAYVQLLQWVPPSQQSQLRELTPRLVEGEKRSVFRALYEIEKDPLTAFQDLAALEQHRPAGRTLEQALRDFRSLAQSRHAHRTHQVRDSFATLAAPPDYFDPAAFRRELLHWAAIAEDLELGRRLLDALRDCKDARQYRELKARLEGFLSEGGDGNARTRMLIAAVNGVSPGGFAALEPGLREIVREHDVEATARILEKTAEAVPKYRLPGASRTAQFQQFLELYRYAGTESGFQAVDEFLSAHSTSTAAAVQALAVLAPAVGEARSAVEEHRFLEERGAAGLPELVAYAKLFRVLRQKQPSQASSLARDSLAWAAGQSRTQLAGVCVPEILDEMAALLVAGGSLDEVKAAVIDLLARQGRIAVGQDYVDVNGVRVRRKEAAS